MWKRALVVVAAAVTVAGCGPAQSSPNVEPVSPAAVEAPSVPPTDPPTDPPATPTVAASVTQHLPTQPPATPTERAATDSDTAQGSTSGSGSSGGGAGSCGQDYYRNSDGVCVHRPASGAGVPAGATARCADGTYSYSTHRSGTCSHHGGVAIWY